MTEDDAKRAVTREPLPKDVVLLGWVSFFNDVSSEMIYPLLPLFTVVVLETSAIAIVGPVDGSMVVDAVVTQPVRTVRASLRRWRR